MTERSIFPPLDGWEPTKQTLHAYSLVIGLVPRAHAIPHPRWWHISLKVQPDGLATDNMQLPGGGVFYIKLDLLAHQAVVQSSRGERLAISLSAGYSAQEFAQKLLGAVAGLGLQGEYAHSKYKEAQAGEYDPEMAQRYLSVLANVDILFKQHRAGLEGEVGPVQLWPHGFDLSFEWFGTRVVRYEERGETKEYPAQLNLGFSPGESSHPQPYFYSNPWPFEADRLVGQPLPKGARWFDSGWQGSLLPYAELAGKADAGERLLEYARAVYAISAPTLMA